MTECRENTCDRKVVARGMCRMHYLQQWRAGTVTDVPAKARTKHVCPPDHAHDVTCWLEHGCRDAACVHARAMERQRRRNRLRAYGRAEQIREARVSADCARQHIVALRAETRVGLERLADLAGVPRTLVLDVYYGRRGKHHTRGPVSIRPAEEARILALAASDITVDDMPHGYVDATGTVRRLRALVAQGHTQTVLAGRLGMETANLNALILRGRDRVLVKTRDAVRALFAELWIIRPDGWTADLARRVAAHRRWAGPLAWDDIDNPDEQPTGVARARDARYAATDYLDDVVHLLELGESREQAAIAVGRSIDTILKAAERHGRDDVHALLIGGEVAA